MSLSTDRPELPLAFRKTAELEKLLRKYMEEVHVNETTVDMERRAITRIVVQQHFLLREPEYNVHKLAVMISRLEGSKEQMTTIYIECNKISHRTEDEIKIPLRRLFTQIDELDKKVDQTILLVRHFLGRI
ncbi:hypothetical protein PRIPAC_95937 [Pristionchus pacificus]|uniref:Uncharacterized protein n=1 Tax=Pristionchus pacificus TaxID=54126 RepID=A0A454Y605_PRIPA|nr:hypothetical protein PRIPAC_95937 [Pristionchus pacificus]|eukprot:PDM81675.1 hypothetical protein PRIPAC_30656 [Pristionchus pacificus]